MLAVGDELPELQLDSTVGPIIVHDLIAARMGVVVTFARPFDAVTTTELGMLAKLADEFQARQAMVIAIATDTTLNLRRWAKDTEELQECRITFPILADTDYKALMQLGVAQEKGDSTHIRSNSVFIVDLDRRIQHASHYPQSVGRNFYEYIRIIDAMQLVLFNRVSTPANWAHGEDVFLHDDVTADQAAQMFPKGYIELRPWFRLTPPPDP